MPLSDKQHHKKLFVVTSTLHNVCQMSPYNKDNLQYAYIITNTVKDAVQVAAAYLINTFFRLVFEQR